MTQISPGPIGMAIVFSVAATMIFDHIPEIQSRICLARGMDAIIRGGRTVTCIGFPYEIVGDNIALWAASDRSCSILKLDADAPKDKED